MSRLAAYLGPPIPAADLLEAGSSALTNQSSEAPDGFGLGWYPLDGLPAPVVLVSGERPRAGLPALDLPRRYKTECALACLSGLSQESPALSTNQPHRHGRYLFQHLGELNNFQQTYARGLWERLTPEFSALVQHNTASELLFATWLQALGQADSPDAMANALEQTIGSVQEVAGSSGDDASFAIIATNGANLVTLRAATHGSPPPLYSMVASDSDPLPTQSRVITSEPLFPGAWAAIDPHALIIFTVDDAPLPEEGDAARFPNIDPQSLNNPPFQQSSKSD